MMVPPDDLLQALDTLDPTTWSGVTYRFTSVKRANDPLSGGGAYLHGGRWNPRESFPCIYLAEPRETALAELRRRADAAAGGAHRLPPQVLHEVRVNNLEVVDLVDPENREHLGVTIDDIEGDDWSACQAVGAAAFFLGFQGVRAPSATRTGQVVAVFERKLRPGQLVSHGQESIKLT